MFTTTFYYHLTAADTSIFNEIQECQMNNGFKIPQNRFSKNGFKTLKPTK